MPHFNKFLYMPVSYVTMPESEESLLSGTCVYYCRQNTREADSLSLVTWAIRVDVAPELPRENQKPPSFECEIGTKFVVKPGRESVVDVDFGTPYTSPYDKNVSRPIYLISSRSEPCHMFGMIKYVGHRSYVDQLGNCLVHPTSPLEGMR